MPKKKTYGADEARTLLPQLLERAHRGESSVVTKRGKPYAAIVPVERAKTSPSKGRVSLLALEGRGSKRLARAQTDVRFDPIELE